MVPGLHLVVGSERESLRIVIHAAREEANHHKTWLVESPLQSEVPGTEQVEATGDWKTIGTQATQEGVEAMVVTQLPWSEAASCWAWLTPETTLWARIPGQTILSSIPSAWKHGLDSSWLAQNLATIRNCRVWPALCPKCRVPMIVPPALAQATLQNASIHLHNPVYAPNPQGCDTCNQGYTGKHYCTEFLRVGPLTRKALTDGLSNTDILTAATQEGYVTMSQLVAAAVQSGAITATVKS